MANERSTGSNPASTTGTTGSAPAGNKGMAQPLDATAEEAFWKQNHDGRPYADGKTSYDDFAPAYRYGWETCASQGHTSFDAAEPGLRRGWDRAKGASKLPWDKAKLAIRDAWERASATVLGKSGRNGN